MLLPRTRLNGDSGPPPSRRARGGSLCCDPGRRPGRIYVARGRPKSRPQADDGVGPSFGARTPDHPTGPQGRDPSHILVMCLGSVGVSDRDVRRRHGDHRGDVVVGMAVGSRLLPTWRDRLALAVVRVLERRWLAGRARCGRDQLGDDDRCGRLLRRQRQRARSPLRRFRPAGRGVRGRRQPAPAPRSPRHDTRAATG
jgi:hypothetical protein